ncbi:haloacid dehalogenase-like hydrolase [Nocardioides alpinus]|uniref:Haloacid dehalogenase-like hydrolase n=1 Tax=Nocardioides alpinus TaxID=748909 RepID=A0A1I1B0F8_9ACTN|nr:HAD family hydrolase [Nocardioides alpinus]PKH41051.1 haloacid dehalogenase-like hydrolase [Nocardioides alpinus]SFB42138.1 haloacid dehalogenase-like hydrolase [Nocardioides alpinus]
MSDDRLPSWRPGRTRDAVLAFLAAAPGIAPRDRVACFDNDGTLWCERPTYVQLDFFVDVLRSRADDPALAGVPELAAVLAGDRATMGEMGLERIALALLGIFEGVSPEHFTAQVRAFMDRAEHATLGCPVRSTTYVPMLELVAALRALDFTVCIVTGGGAEFVRAVSHDLYGVPPEAVVGSLVDYDYVAEAAGAGGRVRPVLHRTARVSGVVNEGAAKVSHIQTHLGRRPVLAAGNSGGDREMLEWTAAGEGPTLALLVDHDDDVREFAYVSSAESVQEPELILDVAARAGWTVVSMARDWETVFKRLSS